MSLPALRAYDTLKRMAFKVLSQAVQPGGILLCDAREHPDLFKEDYIGLSLEGWMRSENAPALNAVFDDLSALDATLYLRGYGPYSFVIWLRIR